MTRTIRAFKVTKKSRSIPRPNKDDMISFWTNFNDELLKKIRDNMAYGNVLLKK
jgi:hypothetical protein